MNSVETLYYVFNEFNTKNIQNHMVWKKTKSNDGSGFCPNVTVTSVATMYYVFAADLLNFFVSEFKFKIILSGKKQSRTTGPDFVQMLL